MLTIADTIALQVEYFRGNAAEMPPEISCLTANQMLENAFKYLAKRRTKPDNQARRILKRVATLAWIQYMSSSLPPQSFEYHVRNICTGELHGIARH